MTKPIDAYRRHREVCDTVTFSPWAEGQAQSSRPGRTSKTLRRRPKRTKPKLYVYDEEPGTERVAYSLLANKQRNTLARPKPVVPIIGTTAQMIEEPMQRTPALPDPNAPEEEMVRIAQSEVNTLFEAMEEEEQRRCPSEETEICKDLIHPRRQHKSAGLLKQGAEREDGSLPSWLVPALAGAGGLGAYALARRRVKAPKGSELAKIQELAGGRMARGDAPRLPENASWVDKLKHSFIYGPSIDPDDPVQLARFAKGQKEGVPAVWEVGFDRPVKGTFNPALGAVTSARAQGKRIGTMHQMHDKLQEAQLLEKFAPGTMARTVGIGGVLKKHKLQLRPGEHLPGDLAKLQEALKTEFGPGGYMMKTRSGKGAIDFNLASSGVFPTEGTDLAKAYKQWRAMRPEFQREMAASPQAANPVIERFRARPGYEGRVIDEALRDNVIVQQKLDLQRFGPRVSRYMRAKGHGPTREFRVHVVGGRAIPEMAMPRYPTPAALVDMLKARKAARWAQKNVLDKLPETHRGMSMGMDVAPLRGGDYRVIETNLGGGSGLLDNPYTSQMLHKAITGQFTRPAAAVLGGAGAAGGAGAGLLAQKLAPEAKKKPELPQESSVPRPPKGDLPVPSS